MVNSSLNNAITNSAVGSSIYHKQSTLPIKKKLALRDVQNENRSFVPTNPENNFLGRQVDDPIKVLGSKILSPEIPRSGAPCHQFQTISSASNHLMPGGAVRKLDSELGKRKVQCLTEENTGCLNFKRPCSHKQPDLPKEGTKKDCGTSTVPASAPMSLVSPLKYSPGQSASPVFLGKPTDISPAVHSSHLRFTPGCVAPYMVDSQRNHEEQRTEQFLHLQNLLQYFDEPDHKDYIELLRALPSFELSRHAVELEKRSMQLSVEEAKEIQRMRALNILGKSSMTSSSPIASECVQYKK